MLNTSNTSALAGKRGCVSCFSPPGIMVRFPTVGLGNLTLLGVTLHKSSRKSMLRIGANVVRNCSILANGIWNLLTSAQASLATLPIYIRKDFLPIELWPLCKKKGCSAKSAPFNDCQVAIGFNLCTFVCSCAEGYFQILLFQIPNPLACSLLCSTSLQVTNSSK